MHTHESSREFLVGANFSVNLNKTLSHDFLSFVVSEGVLESVAKENTQRQTFAELVGTGVGTRSVASAQLIEHPTARGVQTLQMFSISSHLESDEM